ncbi:unnamed protein product, partial [Sphagnum jensenii]
TRVATGETRKMWAEGGEEEVDIDDDLAPVQFAPVVIDKDRGAETGGSKSSSSDGDSSDSGSSSGKNLLSTMTPAVVTTVLMKTPSQPYSDSGSSSGSESNAEDAQSVGAGSKTAHEKV